MGPSYFILENFHSQLCVWCPIMLKLAILAPYSHDFPNNSISLRWLLKLKAIITQNHRKLQTQNFDNFDCPYTEYKYWFELFYQLISHANFSHSIVMVTMELHNFSVTEKLLLSLDSNAETFCQVIDDAICNMQFWWSHVEKKILIIFSCRDTYCQYFTQNVQ
jgi:hypothetical protein